MAIKAQNISFKYTKNSPLILEDINFTIKPNSITAIIGLNGCGKTTLIKMLAGLEKPDNGQILIDDPDNDIENENIFGMSHYKRSKAIAYVSQNINNVDFLVKDYLALSFNNQIGFFASPSQEQIKEIEEKADNMFGIKHLLNKSMVNLSGGERQIVCIFAAILQNANIILLDEPTSALDIKNQHMVLTIIKKLKAQNKTIIFSTHNPNHALYLNSDVIVIDNHKLKYHALAREVVSKSKLKEVYGDNLCLSKDQPYDELSFQDYDH